MNRLALFLALSLAAIACSSNKSTTAARRPPLRDGIYSFSERPPQTSQVIEGTFTVLADTVILDAHSGICRYDDRYSSRSSPFIYRCDGVTITFDRFDPVRKAAYSTTRTVYERQQVCDQYGTNAQGQRICIRYRTETVERQVPVNGLLHPQRVSDPTG